MKYTVEPWVFEKNPDIQFGIILGENLINTPTTDVDSKLLLKSEMQIAESIDSTNLKTHPSILVYRDALTNVGINPNKYMNSVEGMCKRVVKSKSLPRINALVDLCNAISLREVVSLGAHDLKDIDGDLAVRLSTENDKFLPFGQSEYEDMPEGELVFTSDNIVQTRQWLWRQSELGKITLDSSLVVFQIVGFKGEHESKLTNAMKSIEDLIVNRFGGSYTSYIVNSENTEITIDSSI